MGGKTTGSWKKGECGRYRRSKWEGVESHFVPLFVRLETMSLSDAKEFHRRLGDIIRITEDQERSVAEFKQLMAEVEWDVFNEADASLEDENEWEDDGEEGKDT